jgi:hypothetical protein
LLDFDATIDNLSASWADEAQPNTVLAVVFVDTPGGFAGLHGAPSGSQKMTISSGLQWFLDAGGIGWATFTSGGLQQLVAVFNGATSMMYVNNDAGTGTDPGASAAGGIIIGSNSWGYFDGTVGELARVHGVISPADRTAWNTYCHTKWGTP